MSWYNYTKRKCTKCGYEFNQSNDTLSKSIKNYNKCPRCFSSTVIIDTTNFKIEDYYKIGKNNYSHSNIK